MDILSPSNISDDQYLEGFSEAGEARMRTIDVVSPSPRLKFIDGATYTLVDDDHGKILAMNEESTVTIPVGLRDGFMCGISQESVDVVTVEVEAESEIVLQSDTGEAATETQYVIVTLMQWGDALTYRLIGRTA